MTATRSVSPGIRTNGGSLAELVVPRHPQPAFAWPNFVGPDEQRADGPDDTGCLDRGTREPSSFGPKMRSNCASVRKSIFDAELWLTKGNSVDVVTQEWGAAQRTARARRSEMGLWRCARPDGRGIQHEPVARGARFRRRADGCDRGSGSERAGFSGSLRAGE